MENFTGEQAWRDWSFQFKATTRIANETAYHLIETVENEEKEINDVLLLSEEQRSLSSGIFDIFGTLIKGEPHQKLHTSGSSGFEAYEEATGNKHEGNENSIWKISLAGIARKSIKRIAITVNGYQMLIREIRQRSNSGTSSKHAMNNGKKNAENRRELNWRKGRMKDWRKETITMQKMTMTPRQRQRRTTLRQSKARADNLTTEFPFVMGREFPRNEIKMIINQRTETEMQTSETGQRMGEQWESQWRNTMKTGWKHE